MKVKTKTAKIKETLFNLPVIEYWRATESFNQYVYFVKVPIGLEKHFRQFPEVAEYRDPSFKLCFKQYKLSEDEIEGIMEELKGKAILKRV